jgi:hypothetical protein
VFDISIHSTASINTIFAHVYWERICLIIRSVTANPLKLSPTSLHSPFVVQTCVYPISWQVKSLPVTEQGFLPNMIQQGFPPTHAKEAVLEVFVNQSQVSRVEMQQPAPIFAPSPAFCWPLWSIVTHRHIGTG